MSFNDLPAELVLEIALSISSAEDLKRFASVDRSLFSLLKPILYKKFAKDRGNFVIALYLAAESRNEENIRLLLNNQLPMVIQGKTTLMEVYPKVEDIINVFTKDLNRYILVDRNHERSPLFWAMIEGRRNLFTKFLKLGIGINMTDRRSQAPLFWALRHRSLETCRRLLKAGATVYMKEIENGYMPIHWAVRHGCSPGMIQLLLDFGPDAVNAPADTADMTPLLLAITWRRHALARTLLKNGADPHGFTADPAAMDMLNICGTGQYMQSGLSAYTPSPLRFAIMERRLSALKMMLKGKVDSLDVIGATSLQHAACDHVPDVAKYLLEMGASVDYMGDRGYTALMQAAVSGSSLTIETLLDAGADVNVCCLTYRRTALHWAAISGRNSVPNIKKLLKAGADIDAVDIGGKTALDHTIKWMNMDGFLTLFHAYVDRGLDRWNAERQSIYKVYTE